MTPKEQAILAAYNATPALQTAGGEGRDNVAIAAAINALTTFDEQPLTIANPAEQGTVPAPITMPGLLGLVGADFANLLASPTFEVWAQGLLQGTPTEGEVNDISLVAAALAESSAQRNFIQVASYLISSDNRPAIKAFARLLFADSKLSEPSQYAVIAAVDAMIDQPGYQATIANPNRQFVSAEEVQNALN